MEKPKNPDTKNPQANQAVNQGRINMQTKKDSVMLHDDNQADQSQGAAAEGQPTSHQGRGAGFSRNIH